MANDQHQSPEGFHRHECFVCEVIWEHSDTCKGDIEAHKCPCCGFVESSRYMGSKEPTAKDDYPTW